MPLSSDLISQFVKITKDETKTKKENSVYGTVVEQGDSTFVRFDGSDLMTPVSKTADAKNGDRVTVMIKNHTAIITGNLSSPAARVADLIDAGADIEVFEALLAGTATVDQLEAVEARVDTLEANTLTADQIEAVEAVIDKLDVGIATVKDLSVVEARVEVLESDMLTAENANLKYARISDLDASNAEIYKLSSSLAEFKTATSDNFTAVDATITNLKTKYANIDFSNIGEAAIKKFYSVSGIIKDLTVSNGTYTGELVGVTITGDLIKANTILADRLITKGTDGLYYKLNTDGIKTEAEQTNQNSLDGSVILAKSITATKINVSDLVAFGATIGGFHITDNSLYSGVKSTVGNTTRGIYLDNDGQTAFGDANRFVKYYKDGSAYKLALSADDISLSGNSLSATLSNLTVQLDGIEVGGRNIMLNSSFKGFSNTDGMEFDSSARSITYKSTALGSTKALSMSISEYGKTRIRGRKITISGEYKANESIAYGTTNPWIGMELSVRRDDSTGGSTQWLSWLGNKTVSNDNIGKWVKVSKTFSVTDYDCTSVGLNIILRDFTGSISLRNLKIEFGNKATDWTSAPEDVDSAIANAEKTATNYLSFGSSGLVIGDMTASTLGNNVLIDSNSVDIRNRTATLASFGADYLYLAKNSRNAKIDLCNGLATLYHQSKYSYDTLFVIDTPNATEIMGTYNPLYVTSTVTGKVAIQFSNVDGTLGSIGMVASGNEAYITRNCPSTAATYSILDTGNFYSLMDSGWLTCAINTSGKFTIYDNGSNIRYRKIGKMVEVVGAIKPKEAIDAGTESYVFGTLPSGYRPSLAITERAQGSGGNSWLFSITTGGDLRYSRYSNGSSCILLPAATWLPFHATFFTD